MLTFATSLPTHLTAPDGASPRILVYSSPTGLPRLACFSGGTWWDDAGEEPFDAPVVAWMQVPSCARDAAATTGVVGVFDTDIQPALDAADVLDTCGEPGSSNVRRVAQELQHDRRVRWDEREIVATLRSKLGLGSVPLRDFAQAVLDRITPGPEADAFAALDDYACRCVLPDLCVCRGSQKARGAALEALRSTAARHGLTSIVKLAAAARDGDANALRDVGRYIASSGRSGEPEQGPTKTNGALEGLSRAQPPAPAQPAPINWPAVEAALRAADDEEELSAFPCACGAWVWDEARDTFAVGPNLGSTADTVVAPNDPRAKCPTPDICWKECPQRAVVSLRALGGG